MKYSIFGPSHERLLFNEKPNLKFHADVYSGTRGFNYCLSPFFVNVRSELEGSREPAYMH